VRILIVDDNSEIRLMLRDFLSETGAEIGEAADGEEAVSLYESNRPDLVLMDVCMERMDGIEATKRILLHDPSAEVVILTQYDDRHVRKQAKQAGAREYFLKDDLPALGQYFGRRYGKRKRGGASEGILCLNIASITF
jgi:CheY-like chemotaxis protein